MNLASLIRLLVVVVLLPVTLVQTAAAGGRRSTVPVTTNSMGTKFAQIAPGDFVMGCATGCYDWPDERPVHAVRLTKGFLLQTTEVTQQEYEAVMGKNPSKYKRCGGDCPVEQVTWFDAVRFANALSEKEGLQPAYEIKWRRVVWDAAADGYRLPTEAEWEYAARAGERHIYAGSNRPGDVAWYKANSDKQPHAVAGRKPNAWGLYDMSGNVAEWVYDRYAAYDRRPVIDPVGPRSGFSRVRRGGHWSCAPVVIRVSQRLYRARPGYSHNRLGFRLARTSR